MKTNSSHLGKWFDRVFVINCPSRKFRLETLLDRLRELRLANPSDIIVRPAVMGSCSPPPTNWKAGGGAWGCFRSHLRIQEDMLHERDTFGDLSWNSYLILEDDVIFANNAREGLDTLMKNLPEDWGQVYLGGQHTVKPVPINAHVQRGRSINRTHAYAINKNWASTIYQHVASLPGKDPTEIKHIDHWLEKGHREYGWPVYCPTKWLAGQSSGVSDISGKNNTDRFWG